MTNKLTFQQAIMALEQFWAGRGCLIWQPYNVQVGAGTMNPATTLRVLGPEPWNVGYVEPSVRPDDSRYGQNPNRMQQHYQYQVILKPDPGNPQELYLQSLEALGIDRREHDIRFVEDNWESPALGAWGLGWEVWLDGQEITQFTYFQQAGSVTLDPVAVEITYGLERIIMALQGVRSFTDIRWTGSVTYGDVLLVAEIEHSKYNLDYADVKLLAELFADFEREAGQCLANELVMPAYDYILKCSHTFNVLDARGAIGVTERAHYFARMRNLTHQVAGAYLKQREGLGFPFIRPAAASVGATPVVAQSVVAQSAVAQPVPAASVGATPVVAQSVVAQSTPAQPAAAASVGATPVVAQSVVAQPAAVAQPAPAQPADFLFEIGCEELPVGDVASAIEQLAQSVPQALDQLRLSHGGVRVVGSPRHLAVCVKDLATRQTDKETVVKGPPVAAAYDKDGQPTKAALGFSRSVNVPVEALGRKDYDGRPYVVALTRDEGRPAPEVLRASLPDWVASLRFPKGMRWNASQVAFPRPIRWLVGLWGETVIDFAYAGVSSGRVTRGLRPMGDPDIALPAAGDYLRLMEENGLVVDPDRRRDLIRQQVVDLAAEVGGSVPDDEALLAEVTHLVESPTALLGRFDPAFLELPQEVLIAVMQKHQRYFPVVDPETGRLLPYFVAVRNGDREHLDVVRNGNEEVLRARYTDAAFFFKEDTQKPLEDFLPRLATLTFQEQMGSVLDKARRLEQAVPRLGALLGASGGDLETAARVARLCKADLGTQMVIELTSLQGIMGREYALRSGELPAVASAIFEHYLPRFAGDAAPQSMPGILVALADRLDSLLGLFAVGLSPSSAADPYGLRRAALGLVQTLVENRLSLSLRVAMERTGDLQPVAVTAAAVEEVEAFIIGRLRVWLREKGLRYDVVEAVLAARGDNPYPAYQAVQALGRWVERPDWSAILNTYGRCVRITREFKERFPLRPEAFATESERRLHEAYLACRGRVAPEGPVDDLLEAFLPMLQPINRFFDDVLVMDKDPDVRQNRLALLQHIAALTGGIADLTQLEGF